MGTFVSSGTDSTETVLTIRQHVIAYTALLLVKSLRIVWFSSVKLASDFLEDTIWLPSGWFIALKVAADTYYSPQLGLFCFGALSIVLSVI
jgi:hypothetical protein